MNLTRTVGIFALVLFLLALLIFVWSLLRPKQRPEGVEVRMPALAMEFVESDAELPAILGKEDDPKSKEWRDGLKTGLKIDYWFIVIYWLLFVGIASVLARSGGRESVWIAVAACAFATAAAACDVVENLNMARVIDARSIVANVATPGLLKWLFSFVVVALLSLTFFGRGGWVWLVGAVCLLIAGVGLAGLVAIKLGARQLWPIEAAFAMMLLVLLPLVACAFMLKPGEFTRVAGSP